MVTSATAERSSRALVINLNKWKGAGRGKEKSNGSGEKGRIIF